LVDILDTTPGFTKIWEYHSPLVLRGLSSKRLIALKDGNRRMSSFPGGFMGQTLNIYDIERVEVIRGPGSVMYGSGAISGIVNVITPDPFDQRGFGMRVGTGFCSNNLERIGLASFNWGSEKIAAQVSGRFEKADEFYYGNDEKAENSFIQNRDISADIGWRPLENHTTLLNVDMHYGGPWGKPVGFNNNSNMKANNENENNLYFALRHTVKNAGVFNNLVFSGFYNHDKRDYHKRIITVTNALNVHEIVYYKNNYGGGQIYASSLIGNSHLLNYGFDGYMFRLDSPSEETSYFSSTYKTSEGVQNAGISSIGFFIQDEWEISPNKFTVMAGTRYDRASVHEGDSPESEDGKSESRDAISGNVGLVYHHLPNTSMTLNIGRAFRMPEAQEMYGETITCRGSMLGNPDVNPEYSWNIDLGYRGFLGNIDFDSALFAIFLDDMIDRSHVPSVEGDVFIYDNIEKARIMGGELLVSYHMNNILGKEKHLIPGVSVVYAYGDDWNEDGSFFNVFESSDPLHGIPPLRLRMNLKHTGKIVSRDTSYFLKIDADYFASQDRLPDDDKFTWGVEETDSYCLIGLSAGTQLMGLAGQPRVNLRVTNLFNKEYKPFSSYIPGMGRNVRIFVESAF
jgi:outer membrane receptor protein involved in Fe transport